MDKASNDACITIKVVDGCQGWLAGVASVFIKREDRDPTLSELDQEANKARDAHTKEHDMLRSHFREEADIKFNYEEYWTAVHSLLNDPEYNSDWTPYYRWHQNPSWPAKSKEPTSKDNPVDLTRPIQFCNRHDKEERKDRSETNKRCLREIFTTTLDTTKLLEYRQSSPAGKYCRANTVPTKGKPVKD
jgi:hypothetical protein